MVDGVVTMVTEGEPCGYHRGRRALTSLEGLQRAGHHCDTRKSGAVTMVMGRVVRLPW